MKTRDIKSNQKGFTLIELLVVIAVIGLLASIVVVSLNSARIKARNTNRTSAVSQLATAFNMAADDNGGIFPDSGGAWRCVSQTCYGGWSSYVADPAIDNATAPYIKKPVDPTGGSRDYGGFVYRSNWSNGPSYPAGPYLHWMLESGGNCGAGKVMSSGDNNVYCSLKLD